MEKLSSSELTLADRTGKVTLSGVLTDGAILTVTPISGSNAGYNALLKLVDTAKNTVLAAYEMTLNGEYSGNMTLTFAVDPQYNGKTLTVYHQKKDRTMETFAVLCANGKISVTVDELSPFLLTAVKDATTPNTPSGDETTNDGNNGSALAPSTGDNSQLLLWAALLFVSGGAATAFVISSKCKKESAK